MTPAQLAVERDRDEARESEARMRAALESAERALSNVLCGLGSRVEGLAARDAARASLSTPAPEPSERMMRVAEAVREEAERIAQETWEGAPDDSGCDSASSIKTGIRDLDLRAIVAKVTP